MPFEYYDYDIERMEKRLAGLYAELSQTENEARCRNLRNDIENLKIEIANAKKALGL